MTPGKKEIKLGTPLYMAPEIIDGKPYGTKCDIFSLGILCCMLLTGKQPFQGTRREQIYLSILDDAPNISYLRRYYKEGSLVTDFVLKCLQKNPNKRYSSAELLNHIWIKTMVDDKIKDGERQGGGADNLLSDEENLIDVGLNLGQYQKMSQFQSTVVAFLVGLRATYEDRR